MNSFDGNRNKNAQGSTTIAYNENTNYAAVADAVYAGADRNDAVNAIEQAAYIFNNITNTSISINSNIIVTNSFDELKTNNIDDFINNFSITEITAPTDNYYAHYIKDATTSAAITIVAAAVNDAINARNLALNAVDKALLTTIENTANINDSQAADITKAFDTDAVVTAATDTTDTTKSITDDIQAAIDTATTGIAINSDHESIDNAIQAAVAAINNAAVNNAIYNVFKSERDGAGDNYEWSFFISDKLDITPPKIDDTNIKNTDSGVGLDQSPVITFDKLMMSESLTTGSVPITDEDGNELRHKLINILSDTPMGFWITNENKEDGSGKAITEATIRHGDFRNSTSYRAQVGSGVKDIYQNCFKPSKGPACSNVNESKPSCCSGIAKRGKTPNDVGEECNL